MTDNDIDLFCIELEHQITTRVKPAIKQALDEKQARFDATLAAHPASRAEHARHAQARADYERRKERQRYVETGQAAAAATKQFATQLAHAWHAPLTPQEDPR